MESPLTIHARAHQAVATWDGDRDETLCRLLADELHSVFFRQALLAADREHERRRVEDAKIAQEIEAMAITRRG